MQFNFVRGACRAKVVEVLRTSTYFESSGSPRIPFASLALLAMVLFLGVSSATTKLLEVRLGVFLALSNRDDRVGQGCRLAECGTAGCLANVKSVFHGPNLRDTTDANYAFFRGELWFETVVTPLKVLL